MRPRLLDLQFKYHPIMQSSGLPIRLSGGRAFDINTSIAQIEVSETKFVTANKQRQMLHEAMTGEPGWMMYVCSTGVIERARHVAANIAASYFERDLKFQWLAQFDRFDRVRFASLRLVVLDALFFDSNSTRRDKIYETINHRCNFEQLSVVVIGQHNSPLAMAEQLGMRPNFMMMLK